jgi:hypothetical protein
MLMMDVIRFLLGPGVMSGAFFISIKQKPPAGLSADGFQPT